MEYCVIYDVTYRLAGDSDLRLDTVTVGTDPPFPPVITRPLRIQTEAEYWVMDHEQKSEFSTGTYYWAVLSADDPDRAAVVASEQIDPAVTFVLSYLAGFTVRSRLLAVYEVPSGQIVTCSTSPIYQEVLEHSPDSAAARSMFSAIQADPTLRQSAHFLNQARKLWHSAGVVVDLEETLRDMAILHLAKALEALANDGRVALANTEDGRVVAEQEKVIADLQADLSKGRSLRRKIGAVEKAQRGLEVSKNRYLDLKLAVLARELKLDESWLGAAKQLARVRNRNIAHAGSMLDFETRRRLFKEEPDGKPSAAILPEMAISAFVFKYVKRNWGGVLPRRGSSVEVGVGATVHLSLGD